MTFKLREYQENAVNELIEAYEAKENACVISPTASGKTVMINTFVNDLLELDPTLKICCTVHRLEILNNLRENVEGNVDFQTVQKLNRTPELQYDVLILDECLDGDTEILTENGYVPFKDYNGTDKVAQWNWDGSVQFVTPKRFIKQKHKVARKIKVRDGRYVFMSENHRQPYMTYRGKTNSIMLAKEIPRKKGRAGFLPVSGCVEDKENHLTAMEQLCIAIQADGYLRPKKNKSEVFVRFAFSKERKVSRLLSILKQTELKYKIGTNVRQDIIITFTLPYRDYKNLNTIFSLSEFDYSKAIDFIEEVRHWDSFEHGFGYVFSSTSKNNVDFIQSIANISGHKTNITTRSRRNNHNTLYHLSIVKGENVSLASMTLEEVVEWNRFMYCVEVESSFFICRTIEGYPFVTGNCHHIVAQSYRNIIANNTKWHCGFTATPIRGYIPEYPDFIEVYKDTWKTELTGLVNDELYTKFILTKSTAELIGMGFLSDYMFVHDYDFHIQHKAGSGLDYTKSEIDAAITPEECIDYVNATLEKKKAIVFCHSIDFAEYVDYGLGDKSVLITSKTSKTQRDEYFESFKNGDIQILVNVDIFAEGVDVPAVDCVYMFRPTRSIPVFFQQIGRALRLAPGKTMAIIYDYVNNYKRLGVEPKDIKLEDMLLTGKFVKESCEYCGAYGVIEGSKDRTVRAIPNDHIREITKWLTDNAGKYYFHYGIKRNSIQIKLRDDNPVDSFEYLKWFILFDSEWFNMYTMPVILNQYNRWEVMTQKNISYAKEKKSSDVLKLLGDCKYSDNHHDYYVVTDNLVKRNLTRKAKIK